MIFDTMTQYYGLGRIAERRYSEKITWAANRSKQSHDRKSFCSCLQKTRRQEDRGSRTQRSRTALPGDITQAVCVPPNANFVDYFATMQRSSAPPQRPKKRPRNPDAAPNDTQTAKKPATKENTSADWTYRCEPCQLTYCHRHMLWESARQQYGYQRTWSDAIRQITKVCNHLHTTLIQQSVIKEG